MSGSLKNTFGTSAPKPRKKRPAPLSIRMTDAERVRLEEKAAGMALSAYIKAVVLEDGDAPRKRRGSQPIKDYQKIAIALDLLGRMNAFSTFDGLLQASDNERLYLSPQIEAEIRKACADIRLIRCHLITALGVKAED